MPNATRRICFLCDRMLGATERYWLHATLEGARKQYFCEECMYRNVRHYAEETIKAMLDGRVEVRLRGGRPYDDSEVKPE